MPVLDALIENPLWIALIWVGLSVTDYYATLWTQKAWPTSIGRHISNEGGLELNPRFEADIARQRGLSRRWMLGVFLGVGVLLVMWGIQLIASDLASGLVLILARAALEIAAGLLLLVWLAVDSIHLRNCIFISLVRRRPDSLRGNLERSYWLNQRTLSSELLAMGAVYLVLSILAWRLFFLAGAIGCLGVALRQNRLASRRLPSPTFPEPPSRKA